jgi:hypothetical protein
MACCVYLYTALCDGPLQPLYLTCFFGPTGIVLTIQYYEALVGTLKAAKRKGLIHFQGQMLFKGMHDHVQIKIVE